MLIPLVCKISYLCDLSMCLFYPSYLSNCISICFVRLASGLPVYAHLISISTVINVYLAIHLSCSSLSYTYGSINLLIMYLQSIVDLSANNLPIAICLWSIIYHLCISLCTVSYPSYPYLYQYYPSHLFINIHPSIYQSVCSYPSIYLFVCLPAFPSLGPSICLSTFAVYLLYVLSISVLSPDPSIHLSV